MLIQFTELFKEKNILTLKVRIQAFGLFSYLKRKEYFYEVQWHQCFQNGYKPRTNIGKDENDDLVQTPKVPLSLILLF
jgi:hypothetical protein